MRPFVVAPIGLPGSGKTTMVRGLAPLLGAYVVSRDTIRSAMFSVVEYTNVEKRAAFRSVLIALRANLELNRSTVLDGICFSAEADLKDVIDAAGPGAEVVPLMCECPVEIAKSRVADDVERRVHSAEDRTPDLVELVASRFWDVPASIPRIDMTANPAQVVEQALHVVRSSRGSAS